MISIIEIKTSVMNKEELYLYEGAQALITFFNIHYN